jgi:hypothetical protein
VSTTPTAGPRWPLLESHVQHFQRRVMLDAIQTATAAYWRRRAATFAAVGTPTCDLLALNCRRHADLLEDIGLDAEARQAIEQALGGAA